MKSKALTGIMLVVVALIWYKVFFRVKENLFGEEVGISENVQAPNFSLIDTKIDTFPIKLDYRDPFGDIGNSTPTIENPEANPIPAIVKVKPIPQPLAWPDIQYYGLIRKTTAKAPLGILSIDGYKHTLRGGESIYDGILVLSIDREKMTIRYKGEVKTFLRD
jgi:hypothetical protein